MKKIDSLNLVPFIDIVLVLLVIVLTSATFISRSHIDIDIPKVDNANSNTSKIDNEDTIITINKNGEFFINDKIFDIANLESFISRLPKDSSIVINGDKESNFDSFIIVMNMLQKLEYQNLFVLVQDDNKK
ncbi:biopolymer transporter ExbD [Helicobacter sp. MIT 99-5507]|uniref:biopolymer transporter ExbD n=1 Tax=Helicobacter sp. MIT 99-5507 TaxID=152489 RepID=UPI000E1F2DFB|nr:biopolymer transporter ExbD [Helicobacter sp. MIT 99-5507]RDU58648.1 biopolymer transporter ExbD [Helicobacter sp. MIT 99-5507]